MPQEILPPANTEGETMFTNLFIIIAVLFCLVMMLRNLLDESESSTPDH
jgi:hypothetical protein